jgi:hypothetical protein
MLFAKIMILWVVLSCTLGPLTTWLFFYGKRTRPSQLKATGPRTIAYRPRPQLTYYGGRAAH